MIPEAGEDLQALFAVFFACTAKRQTKHIVRYTHPALELILDESQTAWLCGWGVRDALVDLGGGAGEVQFPALGDLSILMEGEHWRKTGEGHAFLNLSQREGTLLLIWIPWFSPLNL